MNINRSFQSYAIVLGMVFSAFIIDGSVISTGFVISEAEARVGRPATPRSVAGVSRRSTKRSIRRTNNYIATLPRGCTTVVIDGTSLHQCGSSYYQKSNTQYVIVNVQ
ncbi:MAG: hypothetical protein GY694_10585 [Gammaproteobacteria bacterium]|nr:hypothetical protein [Gammaproteobacteria bacterium]